MGNNNLVNFLLYSYFGIENEEELNDPEKAVEKCAQRAYLDLARTVKYTYSSSKLKKMSDKSLAANFNKAKIDLINYVCQKVIAKSIVDYNENSFDTWHNKKCLAIIETMKKGNECVGGFTYGQAQKWLNMTLKYCWLLGLLGENFDEKNLHVPIDSYIIEALWKDEFWNTPDCWKNNDCRNKILNLKIKDSKYKIGKYASEKYKSWSTWGKDEYKHYQAALKKYLKSQNNSKSPIEWESKVWIETAKNK